MSGRVVQFVVGAAFGAFIGFTRLRSWSDEGVLHAVWTLARALGMGLLAWRYGDRAWEWLARLSKWEP